MEQITHIKLSELNKEIQKTLDEKFRNQLYWIIADVTNHSFKEKNNYHYFDLVEKNPGTADLVAKISGKAWGTGSSRIKDFERITGQRFINNINVLVQVKVSYHPTFGLAVDVINIDTNFTIGVLEQQRQKTLSMLVEKNPEIVKMIGDTYHSRNKSLRLGPVIQKIALVSSKSSAGRQDFLHTLENNPYGYHFVIEEYHTIVQNEANALILRQAMIDIFNSQKKYDVVVIIRGGGAQTDFLIFDNYDTGLVVAKFPIPVITGIGHQKNETVADLMAHTATKTPTKAAEFIVLHNRNFEDALLIHQKSIIIKSQQLLRHALQNINSANVTTINKSRTLISHYKDALYSFNQVIINKTKTILYHRKTNLVSLLNQLLSKPKIITAGRGTELKNMAYSINYYSTQLLKRQNNFLNHYVSVVKLMNPRNILKKGFAIIFKDGKIVKDAALISPGNDLTISMYDYSLKTNVISKTKTDGTEPNL